MRAAGCRIDQLLGIAVVGGNDHGAAIGAQRLLDAAEASVHRFHALDGWRDLPGVADHVGIGKVHDDHVEGLIFDRLHYSICDTRG